MNKIGNNSITSQQLIFLITGAIVGIGALSLPGDLVKDAGQDAWISAILGSAFPIYLAVLWLPLAKKYPDKTILDLSKYCFGKVLGTLLNFIFFLLFLYRFTSVTAGLSNLFLISLAAFQTPIKLILLFLFIGAFTAYKDLRILGRFSGMIFYMTILLSLILVFALKEVEYRNLLPVFQATPMKLLKATKESLFAYNGIEVLFIASPFLIDKNKLKSATFKAIIIVILIYLWFVLITISFLGIDLVVKYIWPVGTVPKAVQVPVISNFRLFFMMLWSVIIFKTISINYFLAAFTLKDIFKKVKKKTIYIFIFCLGLLICLQYKDETTRRGLSGKLATMDAIYSVCYTSSIALVCFLKKGGKDENKS